MFRIILTRNSFHSGRLCYVWIIYDPEKDLTRTFLQTEQDWPIHDTASHIANIGRMIEEMEIKMRNLLQEVRHIISIVVVV